MTIHATFNPIGSTSPKDLIDNAQNLDYLILGHALFYPDRRGVNRLSWAGIEASFAAAQADKEERFQQFLLSSGYQFIGDYAPGLLVAERNQIFRKDGEFYRAGAALALPYATTGVWADESAKFVSVGDAVLRQDLWQDAGWAGYLSPLVGAVARTLGSRLGDTVSVKDFGAKGDGVTDDTAAFATLEASVTGRVIDLHGLSYAVSAIPSANTYINGMWTVGGVAYDAHTAPSILASATDTGGLETPYTGGPENTPTVSGRTTIWNKLIAASQNCRASFVRCVNIGSIYCHAFGNVSGNYSARQSNAGAPQSVNIASEECEVYGFRGANIASIFSRMVASTAATIACRFGFNHASYSANIASNTVRAGFGNDARLTPVIAGGQVTSVAVDSPGSGYTTSDRVTIIDRQAFGTGATAQISSVDADGGITGITVLTGGSGFSGGLRPTGGTYVDAYVVCEGEQIANIASELSKIGLGSNSANVGTRDVRNRGTESLIAASNSGANTASKVGRQVILGGNACSTTALGAMVLSGNQADSLHEGAVVLGRRVQSGLTRSLVGGGALAGSASSANRKFQVNLENGNQQNAGTITGSTAFTDYAEYFENLSLGVIPPGTLVALDGRKVRPAQAGDDILGVVSATALIVAGDSPFAWSQRYLTGEFGEPLMHDVECVAWETEGSAYSGSLDEALDLYEAIPGCAVRTIELHPVENPDYNPDLPNVPRSERPDEWSCVGLLGQVHVRVKGDVAVGDWVKTGADGVGQLSDAPTNLRCMEIRAPYDDTKGYAVAFCLLR